MSEKLTLLPHEETDTSNIILENDTRFPNGEPDISHMILEDDTPLDSFINEKQQRLLTTVFYSGAEIPINVPFIAAANVGCLLYTSPSPRDA